jgi:signal transduction histidine kinase
MVNRDDGLKRGGVSAVIFALGAGTLVAHLAHFLQEDEVAEILAGVVLPAIVSTGLIFAAVVLYRSDLDAAYHLRILGWVIGGALGLAGLGSALLLYQIAHEATLFDVEFLVVNWAATGGLVGFFVGYYDANLKRVRAHLTDQRDALAEREATLERQNERLERLTQIVSHDLRNPLNVAEGHLELTRETNDVSNLGTASDALTRMEDIIEDTLAMAREGQIVGDVEKGLVCLGEAAETSWGAVDTHDATLDVEHDCELYADESRLPNMFENFFRNAVEHGGPDATVRVGQLESGSGFFVADDGPGLPQDGSVFEAGYTTSDDGTGLGLSIVEEIVTAHGWDIDATESRDGGARFEIRNVDFCE